MPTWVLSPTHVARLTDATSNSGVIREECTHELKAKTGGVAPDEPTWLAKSLKTKKLNLAERVGFANHCWLLKTKDLRDFSSLTIRQIRTKASIETRIEHADMGATASLAAVDLYVGLIAAKTPPPMETRALRHVEALERVRQPLDLTVEHCPEDVRISGKGVPAVSDLPHRRTP